MLKFWLSATLQNGCYLYHDWEVTTHYPTVDMCGMSFCTFLSKRYKPSRMSSFCRERISRLWFTSSAFSGYERLYSGSLFPSLGYSIKFLTIQPSFETHDEVTVRSIYYWFLQGYQQTPILAQPPFASQPAVHRRGGS